ncbi:MAG TPA: tetratricopeptide repeat protein [Thermoanaerobaculia bacterium]|nr:tetratricopeptide repeat protein [Thermoanaerobaculia bacterium]
MSVRVLGVWILVVSLLATPVWATCGGGGGGGTGGMGAGSSLSAQANVYQVPWTVLTTGKAVPADTRLTLYWFPASPEEARASALQKSRALTLASARCVGMGLVPADHHELYARFSATGQTPLVVLTGADGVELGRVAGAGKEPGVATVEKLVTNQLEAREEALEGQLDAAKAKEKAGDSAGAISLYREVWAQRCLVPSAGKKAAKALKKLGQPVDEKESARLERVPSLDGRRSAELERVMDAGVAAENAAQYDQAQRLYQRAHELDPADPVPLRYLAELERHHTGEWRAAEGHFRALLSRPADPISRAVALHGLGKMTLHADRFPEGLAMLEESVATFPLPIAYRNLAVYWFSEGAQGKALDYAQQALALGPDDPYNQVFLAVFAADAGRREEALAAAHAHENLLEASYNLAVIHSLSGDNEKALALLKRHFYEYERYDAVRAMEMQEAREDAGFARLHQDPRFIALTAKADGAHPAMR